MAEFPVSLEELVEAFRTLPTIGKKTAQRLALHVVTAKDACGEKLMKALQKTKEEIHTCAVCGNITEEEICSICASVKRDHSTICVVEDVSNLFAMERSGLYRGVYHVLQGLLSPMQDVGPEDIGVEKLLDRLDKKDEPVSEVILAISATLEGETTMLFLAELLKEYDVKVTRIASGIPVGGSLEYYDELTLMKALEDRRKMD